MATSEREAKLVLRADDRATKTFEQVGKSIADVTKNLKAQAAAALAGEGSLDDLAATLKEIQRNGEDLEKQRSAVKAFERSGAAAETAAAAVARSTKAYDDYKAKLGETGAVTDAQVGRLDRLAAAVVKTQAALDKQTANVDKSRERLTALGLSATDTAGQLEQIVTAFRGVQPLYQEATNAVAGYSAAQERAATASAAAVAAAKQQAAEQAQLEKQRRDAIELGIRLTQQREAEEVASAKAAIALAQQRAAAEAQEKDRDRHVDTTSREAFASADNLKRFTVEANTSTAGITRLGEAIRSIVAPSIAEVQSIDGALKQVDDSAALVAAKQKKRTSEYQDSLNALTQAQAALTRQAGAIDVFNKQSAAVDKLDAELAQAAKRVKTLSDAFYETRSAEIEKELAGARVELERVGAETLKARTRFVELDESLKRSGIDTRDVTSEFAKLKAGAEKSAGALDTLNKKVGKGAGGSGFLGLKPYELTNLSYQVNDVFTSLASGAGPLQVLAQQGGQIGQLFQEQIGDVISKSVELIPVIGGVAAAVGTLVYQYIQLKNVSDAVKGFDQFFALSGNAAGLSADQFGRAQLAIEKLNVSADDAKSVLRDFIEDGLNPAGLNTYIKTVDLLSKALGESFPEVAKLYSAALTGGYDAVVALNDKTGVLNDTEIDHIETLFNEGKAQDARTFAAERYEKRMDAIAAKSKTEWSTSVDSLGTAWDRLNDAFDLSSAASFVARQALNDLTDYVNIFTGAVKFATVTFQTLLALRQAQGGLGGRPLGTFAERITGDVTGDIAGITKDRKESPVGGSGDDAAGKKFIRNQETQLKNAKLLNAEGRIRVAQEDALNKAADAGVKDPQLLAQIKLNAAKIEQDKLDKEATTRGNKADAAARKRENEAKAAAREAETRQNKIDSLTKDLENTYASLSANRQDDPFKAIQVKAENAVRNIQAKFADLGKLGVTTVNGKTAKDYEAAVAAAAALETSQARQKQNEEDVNKLLELRKTQLADIEDRQRTGDLAPKAAIQEAAVAIETLNPQIEAAARNAVEFAKTLRGAVPDPKLEAFIAKMESTLRESSGRGSFVDVSLSGLKSSQGTLDALVAQRDAVVQLQNALVKAGLKTAPDAQRAIKAAFDNSRPAILAAAGDVESIVDSLLKIPGLSPTVVASLTAIKAALAGTRAETKLLDADVVALKNAAVQALSGAISDFITTLGGTIADVLDGTSSLKDALKGIAGAALSFAANFTKAIAQAIVQLVALKIAKAALNSVTFLGGGFHQGGVIGRSGPTFTRKVSPLAFAGAVRYHTGGLVGTRPDEVPAILQKGEEVITANDPRHRDNGGLAGGSSAPVTIKNINLFDAGEAVSQGANTRAGEQAIMNVVQRNKTALGIA